MVTLLPPLKAALSTVSDSSSNLQPANGPLNLLRLNSEKYNAQSYLEFVETNTVSTIEIFGAVSK